MKPLARLLMLAAIAASSDAALEAAPGGRVVGAGITNSQMCLSFETTEGYSYQVQSCATLQNRFWLDPLSPLVATGRLAAASAPAPASAGFFRVLEFTNRAFWYDWRYYYETPMLSDWGLGTSQNGYTHLDRPYEWYIDQANTGASANNNCGPSSVTMAIKWYNAAFDKTAEDARNRYPQGGGWWYTSDIINYLNLYSVPNTTSGFTGANQLAAILDQGRLVILCLSTAYLSRDTVAEHRVGRFYSFAGGHFLVVKGWRTCGGALWFEVYDPNNWHALYTDGTPKGRNRHLVAADLASAISNWWNYLIVVHPAGKSAQGPEITHWLEPVDPARIPHMPGM